MFIELLRDHLDDFNQAYDGHIPPSMHQAIFAMLNCRSTTNTERTSQWACQGCTHTAPLSCGHRSCPLCQHNTTEGWLNKQQAKLLPVDYFMVTFTLPYELRSVTKQQPELMYQAMFSVAASVLKDFAKNAKQLGGEMGVTGVLHTHNRRRAPCVIRSIRTFTSSFRQAVSISTKNNGKRTRVNTCSTLLILPKSGEQDYWPIWKNIISNCLTQYPKSGWLTANT